MRVGGDDEGLRISERFREEIRRTGTCRGIFTEGLTKGLTEGLTKGRTEGSTEEAARNLLTVLRIRGIAVPDTVRERILTQKDPERLERWLEKAVVASSVAAVLDEPS